MSAPSDLETIASEDGLITKEMVEEEKRLQILQMREQERLRKKYEKEMHDQEMRELRYKRLMNLLEKSQFFSRFMHEKVEQHLAEKKIKENKNHANVTSSGRRKRKPNKFLDEYSEEIYSASKRGIGAKENISPTKLDVVKGKDEARQSVITGLGIEVSSEQPKLLEGAALRDYQIEGLNWLKVLFSTGLNGILADEMGLGKTVQVISLICHLFENNVVGPFLIVGPLSTLPNWVIEFQRFAPQLPVVLYHGHQNERLSLQKVINKKTKLLNNMVHPVVLTSYEVPIRDSSFLSTLKWKYIIVDEGHRLKNSKTILAQTLSSFSSVNRLLLTGTPLQNNLTELWSLLHFLLPEIFDKLDTFQSWFEVEDIERSDMAQHLVEQEKKEKILTTLHQILTPFLLRRVKSEVNLKLPPKKEVLVYCPMSEIQRKIYESILDLSIAKLLRGSNDDNIMIPDNPDGTKVKRRSALRKSNDEVYTEPEEDKNTLVVSNGFVEYHLNVKLQNRSMALRKSVNHPYLINVPVLPGSSMLRVDEGLVTDCGKMTVLDGLLSRLKAKGHKVILFSTFTTVLDLIEELMVMRDYDYERLDGRCKLDERKKSICRFNTDENVFVFLISTRAGGLGINLTAADTAIIYDSDWNPQADLQAQDRCHRIGQTRPVIVYRFITEGTLDEKIYSRATAKRKLEKIIIQGGKFNNSLKDKDLEMVDLEELRELLNSKPSCQELRTDGSVLSEETWASLLDRSDLLAAMEKSEL